MLVIEWPYPGDTEWNDRCACFLGQDHGPRQHVLQRYGRVRSPFRKQANSLPVPHGLDHRLQGMAVGSAGVDRDGAHHIEQPAKSGHARVILARHQETQRPVHSRLDQQGIDTGQVITDQDYRTIRKVEFVLAWQALPQATIQAVQEAQEAIRTS